MSIAFLSEHKGEFCPKSKIISVTKSGKRQIVQLSDASLEAVKKALKTQARQSSLSSSVSVPRIKTEGGFPLLGSPAENAAASLLQRKWRLHRIKGLPRLRTFLKENLPEMNAAKRLNLSVYLHQRIRRMALDPSLTNQYVTISKLLEPKEIIKAGPTYPLMLRDSSTPHDDSLKFENVDFYLEKSLDGSTITAQIYGDRIGSGFFKTIYNSNTITFSVQKEGAGPLRIKAETISPTVLVRSNYSQGSRVVCEPLRGLNLVRSRFSLEERDRNPDIKISIGLSKLRLRATANDSILEGEDHRFAGDLTMAVDNKSITTTDTGKVRPFSLEKALKALVSVGNTLRHFHRKGIVHRDVSGRNIFINDNLDAYLADFDLCVETGSYLIPGGMYHDALEEKGLVTPLTDIFSLSITLGRLLFGPRFYLFINRLEGKLIDRDIEGHSVLHQDLKDGAIQEFYATLTNLAINTQFITEHLTSNNSEPLPASLIWGSDRKDAIATALDKYENMIGNGLTDEQSDGVKRAVALLKLKIESLDLIGALIESDSKTIDFLKNNQNIANQLSDKNTSAAIKQRGIDRLLSEFPAFGNFFNALEGLLQRCYPMTDNTV